MLPGISQPPKPEPISKPLVAGIDEHGVREHGLELVEARLAQATGGVANHTRHGAADAVVAVSELGDQVLHALWTRPHPGIAPAGNWSTVSRSTVSSKPEEGRVCATEWVLGRRREQVLVADRGDEAR